ncbi:FAD:protein FMN transferase ApbE [Litorivicinus lipolyticus]|uniref:FAD:protein FMN transferase n=1 Tax=Litorivicinus lipolyticus TaxID=418701 RepID=A0A5Q2QD48_9GAMM|nr:FAD:protein FMN transferase [Litorivicinus lipolyticus]QGG79946.1 FAD:protein FMN transferase ApbE [Litorivicinus lipolyticus]
MLRSMGLIAALLLAGCWGEPRTLVTELAGKTMGTTWSVKIAHPENRPVTDALQAQVAALLVEVNNQMSTWQSDSEVSAFNALAAPASMEVSRPFASITAKALDLARISGGQFDPTIGPVVGLWGFGPPKTENRLPTDAEIDAARAQVGYAAIAVDGQRLSKTLDRRLDLSAIAKGHGVDVVADHLISIGYLNHLVEIGGEMRAGGDKLDLGPWRVAIEKPIADDRAVQQIIAVRNIGIATSGDYRNYREIDGEKYHHAMDPSTGRPVTHSLGSVTVLHPSSAMADGWATTLLVLGQQRGMALATEHGLAAYFITRGDGLKASYTPAFAAYLEGVE